LKVEGLSEAIKIPALIGYLLYFEANEGWSDQDELEKIYSLRKQLLDFPSQAGFHNYISAANTCRELKKWDEVIIYCKKGFKYYSRVNPAQVNLKSFSEPIAIYEKVIEAQVESELFDDAMETFSKIKKANLHSLNASDVDISNSKNKILELDKLYDQTNWRSREYFKNPQKITFILGRLCQWKSEIFKSSGDLREEYNWMKVTCDIYNFLLNNLSEFILEGFNDDKDLIERTIYSACTIYLSALKRKIVEESQVQDFFLKRLKPLIDGLNKSELKQKGKSFRSRDEFGKFVPKSFKRFSMPLTDSILCIDAIQMMLNSRRLIVVEKELDVQLQKFKLSLIKDQNSQCHE